MTGRYAGTWVDMVKVHNQFYQDLVQSDDYPPAKGGKKDQDESIQALIAKTVDQKLSKITQNTNNNGGGGNKSQKQKGNCYNCGAEDHCAKDCPEPKKNNSEGGGSNRNWRTIPPSASRGESKEKTVNGVVYKLSLIHI